MVRSLHYYFRANFTQAIIIGMLSFIGPGIFAAIKGLGGGGLTSATTANAAYLLSGGIVFITSPLWGVFANKYGLTLTLILGSLGNPIYSGGLYNNSKTGTQWPVLLCSALSGIFGGAFWTAEAAIAIYYPEEKTRGIFIATWQFLNKFGIIIAGAITLSLNSKGKGLGGISLKTYIVLLSIQCIGPPASLLLAPPGKVIRSDGSKIKSNVTKNQSLKERLKDVGRVMKKKEILLLTPCLMGGVWLQTWQSNYTADYFSTRARSLCSFVTAIICMLTDLGMGFLLDLNYKRSIKMKISWLCICLLMIWYYIYAFIMQAMFNKNDPGAMDWTDKHFYRAYIPFLFGRIGMEAIYNWFYYYLGSFPLQPAEITIGASIIRAFESLGECLAFAIGATNNDNMVSLAVAAAIFFASAIPVTYGVLLCNDETITTMNEDEEEEEEDTSIEKIPDIIVTEKGLNSF